MNGPCDVSPLRHYWIRETHPAVIDSSDTQRAILEELFDDSYRYVRAKWYVVGKDNTHCEASLVDPYIEPVRFKLRRTTTHRRVLLRLVEVRAVGHDAAEW